MVKSNVTQAPVELFTVSCVRRHYCDLSIAGLGCADIKVKDKISPKKSLEWSKHTSRQRLVSSGHFPLPVLGKTVFPEIWYRWHSTGIPHRHCSCIPPSGSKGLIRWKKLDVELQGRHEHLTIGSQKGPWQASPAGLVKTIPEWTAVIQSNCFHT